MISTIYTQSRKFEEITSLKGKTFTAVVLDNRDPKKRNRIKVAIDGVTDAISTDKQPYLSLKTSPDQTGNKNVRIPPVYSRVEVYCPSEDIVDAIIIGQINSKAPKRS